MFRSVVIVRSRETFLVSTLEDHLTEAHYNVEAIFPDIDEIKRFSNLPSLVIVYGSEELLREKKALLYLKDQVIEDGDVLLFIGSLEERNEFYHIVPEPMVRKTLLRPLNLRELLHSVKLLEDEQKVEDERKRILVVDDDGMYLRTVQDWLSEKYNVTSVNSGAAALSFLSKHDVDLILLDYEMPVVDGSTVLEMIRSEAYTEDIPVFFLTGKSDKKTVMKLLDLKPDGYLLKSMSGFKILNAIAEFFEKRGQ